MRDSALLLTNLLAINIHKSREIQTNNSKVRKEDIAETP